MNQRTTWALFILPSRQLCRFASLAFVRDCPVAGQQAAGRVRRGMDRRKRCHERRANEVWNIFPVAGKELGNLTAGMPGRKSNLGWLSADTPLFQNFPSEQDCNVLHGHGFR